MGYTCQSLNSLTPSVFPVKRYGKSIPPAEFRCRKTRKSSPMTLYSRLDKSADTQQQQLNLSVLRFTLGIPGLDESYLPRYIGYAFGSLLVLNHFLGSDSSAITAAQLRTEVLGGFLAAFSVIVPYLGKFLKVISLSMFYVDIRELKFYNILPKLEDMLLKMNGMFFL
nr:uncharacterized protein LOC104106191 [Nicotiana tomentosiformis]